MDGWVVIGSKLDTKELEKDLKSAEKRLRDYEKEAEQLTKSKAKAEIDLRGYEEAKRNIQQMTDEALQLAQTQGEVDLQLRLEATQMEELNAKYATQKKNLDEVNRKIVENKKNQALVNQEIQETNRRLNSAKGLGSIQGILSGISKQTNKVISSVGRWALAIFGVRSAYNFIRSSISTLSQYNTQMATDIEYIRYALASTLQPVIEKLIQLVFRLLSYVNYLAKAWFGIDLFANASADAMNRTATSAEKVKKSLAGFDEMNVLNENGTTGAMGAGVPSVDLSNSDLSEFETPEWLVWLKDNGANLIPILTGIGGALLGIWLGMDLIKSLKFGLVVGSITNAIQKLLDYAEDPSWEKMTVAITAIGIAISAVGIAFGSSALIIAGAVTAIVGVVAYMADEISKCFGFASDKIEEESNNIKKESWSLKRYILDVLKGLLDTFELYFGNYSKSIKGVLDGIVLIFQGEFKEGILKALKSIVNLAIGLLNLAIDGLNHTFIAVRGLILAIGKVSGKKWTLDDIKIPHLPTLATGGIVNMPGRGIPVGGAIAGEAGREGVLPLTNSQTMKELGQEIGKYITINANITNTMNGRVISRELQKINANSDFATNS